MRRFDSCFDSVSIAICEPGAVAVRVSFGAVGSVASRLCGLCLVCLDGLWVCSKVTSVCVCVFA
jgi:hypothetical protein